MNASFTFQRQSAAFALTGCFRCMVMCTLHGMLDLVQLQMQIHTAG